MNTEMWPSRSFDLTFEPTKPVKKAKPFALVAEKPKRAPAKPKFQKEVESLVKLAKNLKTKIKDLADKTSINEDVIWASMRMSYGKKLEKE